MMLNLLALFFCQACTSSKVKEKNHAKAMVAIEQGDIKQALTHLDKVIKAEPLPHNIALKGTLLYQTHQFQESKRIFERLLKNKQLSPTMRAEIMNNYACCLNQLGEHWHAQMLWQQLANNSHYQTKEVAWFNLGMLSLKESKQLERWNQPQSKKIARVAVKRFDQALKKEPHYIDALFYQAQAYVLSKQDKLAVQSLKKVLSIAPDHQAAHELMIKCSA